MTRINVGIDPRELPTKLLLAEHRELKRIPNCVKSGRFNLNNIPEKFTLGTGHVSFFYNKILYLKNRYGKIYKECLRRKCNVQDFSDSFENIPDYFLNDYQETERDRFLLMERIQERGFELIWLKKTNDLIE